ncbi:MAG: ABC transporter substrate-binding protein [Castellaniella sp.]
MSTFTKRRSILKATAAMAGAGALPFIGMPAFAQQNEATILGIIPLTGPYAADGERIQRGQQMALEDFNRVAGSRLKINYISRDTAGDVGTAIRRIGQAHEREKPVAIAGPWADDVAAAVSEFAQREKIVHAFSGGPLPCHRYNFQWAPPYYAGVRASMEAMVQQHPDAKRWYLLTSDYAFGWTVEELERKFAPELGIEIVGAQRHVLGEKEFSPYMGEISAAAPDVIVFNNFGLDTAQSLRTAFSFGLTQQAKILVPWGSGIEDYLRLDPAISQGIIIGTAFYYTIDNPIAKSMAERYIERFNEPPGYPAGSGYAVMQMLLAALADLDDISPASLATALEGWHSDDTLVGSMTMDADTHQAFRPFFVTQGKAPNEIEGKFDLARIIATSDGRVPAGALDCKGVV